MNYIEKINGEEPQKTPRLLVRFTLPYEGYGHKGPFYHNIALTG